MTLKSTAHKIEGVNLALGGLLILLGIVFAIAQFVGFDFMHLAWPIYVIAPSALLFVFGLTLREGAGEAFTILGMMGAATGALLFVQNITNHWESWAYAWALVAPTAVGIAQVFYGVFYGRTNMVRRGLRLAGIGLALFLLGAFFFELVIGFSGYHLGGLGVAVLLILLGLGLILRPLLFAATVDVSTPQDAGTFQGEDTPPA